MSAEYGRQFKAGANPLVLAALSELPANSAFKAESSLIESALFIWFTLCLHTHMLPAVVCLQGRSGARAPLSDVEADRIARWRAARLASGQTAAAGLSAHCAVWHWAADKRNIIC